METKEKATEAAESTQCKGSENIWRMPTRRQKLLRAFLEGRRLTSIDIVRDFYIADARSEIRNLRDAGYNIKDVWVHSANSKYKVYYMDPV